jgi:hypothetical protein
MMLLLAAIGTAAADVVGLRVKTGGFVAGKLEFIGNREDPSQIHFRLETTPSYCLRHIISLCPTRSDLRKSA